MAKRRVTVDTYEIDIYQIQRVVDMMVTAGEKGTAFIAISAIGDRAVKYSNVKNPEVESEILVAVINMEPGVR